jgi:hypothetical protein
MRRPHNQTGEIREAWARAGNDELLKAVLEDWEGYSSEAQLFIKKEVFKRGLPVAVKPIGTSTDPNSHCGIDWARAVIFLLPLFLIAAIDLGLWRYYEWRDTRILGRIEEQKLFIEREKTWIEATEKTLKSKDEEIHRIVDEASNHPNAESIPERISLDSAIQEYRRLHGDYENRLVTYNEKVSEYNSMIDKKYSRWYLIPIPVKTKG